MAAPATPTKYSNSELMRACGSKTGRWDPESPDQTLWVLYNGVGEERAMAWVKTKTVFMSRSPFCVNEQGQALWMDNLSADCGWSLKTSAIYLRSLETQRRIRIDYENKRIYYRADVPLNETEESETDGEEKAMKDIVQYPISSYVVDFIQSLSGQQKQAAEATLAAFEKWRKAFAADGERAIRAVISQVEDSTYERLGIPKKRYAKRPPPIQSSMVQLSLLEMPEFIGRINRETNSVRDQDADSVQNPKTDLYGAENDSVQNPHPYITSDTDTDRVSKPVGVCREPEQAGLPASSPLQDGLNERFPTEYVSTEAAAQVHEHLEQHAPGYTPANYLAFCDQQLRQARGKTVRAGIALDLERGFPAQYAGAAVKLKLQQKTATSPPPVVPDDSPPEDFPPEPVVMDRIMCRKCGGMIEIYESGERSKCGCAMKRTYG